MNTEFIVTDLGLQLDGRMLLPGSRLIVKNAPHPSWLNVGRVSGQVTEQKLVVASPAAEPAKAQPLVSDALESARAEYEKVTGKKPHHKTKIETLVAEIDAVKQQDDE